MRIWKKVMTLKADAQYCVCYSTGANHKNAPQCKCLGYLSWITATIISCHEKKAPIYMLIKKCQHTLTTAQIIKYSVHVCRESKEVLFNFTGAIWLEKKCIWSRLLNALLLLLTVEQDAPVWWERTAWTWNILLSHFEFEKGYWSPKRSAIAWQVTLIGIKSIGSPVTKVMWLNSWNGWL